MSLWTLIRYLNHVSTKIRVTQRQKFSKKNHFKRMMPIKLIILRCQQKCRINCSKIALTRLTTTRTFQVYQILKELPPLLTLEMNNLIITTKFKKIQYLSRYVKFTIFSKPKRSNKTKTTPGQTKSSVAKIASKKQNQEINLNR